MSSNKSIGGWILRMIRTALRHLTSATETVAISITAASLAVEIASNPHEVGQLAAQHHFQSGPAPEGGVRRLDPGVTSLRFAEDDSQRLVDPHEVREPRLGVPVDTAYFARFPTAIRSNGQVQ
jgi:hypothetical protein